LTGGDLITHQYAQVEGRPSNAPGYPLYTMGGWLWFRIGGLLPGWGLDPLQVLSVYSVLWGVASLGVLYLILLRVTGWRWPIALLLAAFYATTYFFWYYSVTTEQYTSAVLQTLLLIWLAFKWDDQPRNSLLLWMAFISGTMLANMLTTLFILPPLLWFIFFRQDSNKQQIFLLTCLEQPRLVLAAVGLALLPLISYTFIYIRGAQHPEWRGEGEWANTWDWFVKFLTIQQGRDELTPGLGFDNFFTGEFPSLMWFELTWLVFFGGLLGLTFLGRRRAIFLYSTLVIYFIFSWGYRFGNWFQVIIPAYPVFIIGFAAGLIKFINIFGRKYSKRLRTIFYALVMLLLSGLLIYRFATNLSRANQRNLTVDTGLDPGWAILADNPVTPALISGDFSERVALEYLSRVWSVAEIYPVDIGDIGHPPGMQDANIYISRQALAAAPEVVDQGYPQAAGEQLIALFEIPQTELPETVVSANIDFGDQLSLRGWEAIEPHRPAQSNWQIALYWQASTMLTEEYTISMRPLSSGQLLTIGGAPIIQDHQPVWGYYPTSHWAQDEIVRDVYALTVPEDIKPDAMQVLVYRVTETGFENLGDAIVPLKQFE